MKEVINKYKMVPVLITCIIIFISWLIPTKIIEQGFMPKDDALRHAAKAVSGKDWNRILVLRDDIKLDSHAGWHGILGFLYNKMRLNIYQLVVFSVVFLFILFSLVPVLLLERPEAWVLALLTMSIADPLKITRLLLGRPYLVTMAVIIAIGCFWKALAEKKIRYEVVISLTLLTAVATWVHGGWYFFILPVMAFFMARQWRAGVLVALATAAGVVIGAFFTGHPIMLFTQTVKHAFLAFADYRLPNVLVPEFRPFLGDPPVITAVIFMLIWRALRGDWDRKVINNPVAMLALTSWAIGFITRRVWLDIGIAATLVWMAGEYQQFLIKKQPSTSANRLFTTVLLSGLLFIATTNDFDARWSSHRYNFCLVFDTPEKAPWAPGPGGIVYNNDMRIFYSMFYKNPTAPWRYILGFEPGIMPQKDFVIYRNTQMDTESSLPLALYPWVKKMRPEDRMIVLDPLGNISSSIVELDWCNVDNVVRIGKLPKKI